MLIFYTPADPSKKPSSPVLTTSDLQGGDVPEIREVKESSIPPSEEILFNSTRVECGSPIPRRRKIGFGLFSPNGPATSHSDSSSDSYDSQKIPCSQKAPLRLPSPIASQSLFSSPDNKHDNDPTTIPDTDSDFEKIGKFQFITLSI